MTDRRDLARFLKAKVAKANLRCEQCGEPMRSTTFLKHHKETKHKEKFVLQTSSEDISPGSRSEPRPGARPRIGNTPKVCEETCESDGYGPGNGDV